MDMLLNASYRASEKFFQSAVPQQNQIVANQSPSVNMLSVKKHPIFAPAVVLTDIVAILASFLLAYYLRFSGLIIPAYKGIPSIEAYFRAMVVVVPIYLMMFRAYQLYRPARHVRRIYELLNAVKAATMATIFLMALTFVYREFSYSRIVLLFSWLISAFLCSLARYILIQVEYFIRREKDRERVLIIGMNRKARDLINWAKGNPHYGQDIIGIVANNGSHEGKHIDGAPILGDIGDLDSILAKESIDEVIVVDPAISKEAAADLMLKCESKMIGFKLAADFYGLMTQHVDVEYISNVPLLGLKALPLDDVWNRIVKRIFDLVISTCLIIFFSPLFILIAIAIKCYDQGSIFYKQERIGQDGVHFNLYKFRTMQLDAEKKIGPVWAEVNDHRVTGLGKILRRTNLDELPQLWNVLIGNMSLVGPRPERPHFVEQFRDQIPRYMARHKIKSGLTGWAQIHGLRGNTSLEERIKYDLYYMENWTLMMDVEILFATLFAFKNAY